MSRLLSFLLLSTLVAMTSVGAALSPEQEHLNQYAGNWDGTISSAPGAKIRITCEWILDGTFLRHSLTLEPSPGAPSIGVLQLMTYDTTKRVYRAWSFYSDGSSVQGEGEWDAASSTFTWTNHDESKGTTTVTKVAFPDSKTESTFTQIKNRDGEVVSEISRDENQARLKEAAALAQADLTAARRAEQHSPCLWDAESVPSAHGFLPPRIWRPLAAGPAAP
jgi:hypothetical protein